ncbi:MAG: MATE family efflux transporter [Bacillota bacterium]
MQRAYRHIELDAASRSPSLMRRAIVLLAWPVAAEMSLHTITQVVDMAMVGRLGPASVAAVGLSFRPLFFVMSIFLGIGGGTTALVARFIGAEDRNLANRTIHQALLFAAPLSFALAALLAIFSHYVVVFMGAAPDVLPLGSDYVRFMSPGIMLSHLGMVATAGLRGAGDTRTTMRVNAGVNVLNITLNYILIFGHLGFPALGVRGAAIATSTARGIGGLVILALLCRGGLILHLPWPSLNRWDRELVLRILRVGLPAMMERVLNSSAMILQLKMLATQGTTVVAAATLAQNLEELSFLPAIGLSVAASTLVGQMLGRRDPDTAEQAGWQSSYLGAAFMGTMGLLFLIAPRMLLNIYGAEGHLLSMGVSFLRIVGLFQIPMALSNILAGGLRGAGDTASVMYITSFTTWGIRLGLTALVLFVLKLGPVAAYAALCADWFIRAIILGFRFRRGAWKEQEV